MCCVYRVKILLMITRCKELTCRDVPQMKARSYKLQTLSLSQSLSESGLVFPFTILLTPKLSHLITQIPSGLDIRMWGTERRKAAALAPAPEPVTQSKVHQSGVCAHACACACASACMRARVCVQISLCSPVDRCIWLGASTLDVC